MCYIAGLDTSGFPIGTIIDFGHAALPFGFVACDGGSKSTTGTYAKLYAKIGVIYGSVGAGFFNVPMLNGQTRIGPGQYNDAVSTLVTRYAGQYIGAEKHALISSELASHTHIVSAESFPNSYNLQGGSGSNYFTRRSDFGQSITNYTSSSAGSGNSHNNMQPSLVIGNVGIAYL